MRRKKNKCTYNGLNLCGLSLNFSPRRNASNQNSFEFFGLLESIRLSYMLPTCSFSTLLLTFFYFNFKIINSCLKLIFKWVFFK